MENTANNNNQLSGNASKISTDSNGLTGMVSNSATYDNTQIRDTNQFQHLISSDHAQLPPNPPFGMGHHFVTPFPGYMHAVPSGLYSLNMMEDSAEHHPKRRRRTNYRDPENAAKLTTALGILIKQKEENKPQDLKSIASHFGLPYNTLRDNYLKVTTGKLLKDKSDKKSDSETPRSHTPRARKSSTAGGASSTNSSRTSTPREPTTAAAVMAQSLGTVPYGTTAVPAGAAGAQPFGAFQVYHPGMHFMPTMGMQPGGMQHMAAVQQQQQSMPTGAMAAPGMAHPMMAGAPPMMHIFAASPMGFPVNPSTGRPFPMYAPGGPGGETAAQSSGDSSSSVPTTPHTPHMMTAPGMYMGTMPPAAMPVFNPGATAMYAPHMMDPATAAAMVAQQQQQQQQHQLQQQQQQLQPAQQQLQPTQQQPPPQAGVPTGFSLLLPGAAPGFAPPNANVTNTPSSNNAVFLAAAMNAAYADPQNNTTTSNNNDSSTNESSSVHVNATSGVSGVEDSQAPQGQAAGEEVVTSSGNQPATVAVDPTETTSTTNGNGALVEENVSTEGGSGKDCAEGSSDDSGTSADATPTDSNENGQMTTKNANGVGNKHDRR